MHLGYDAHLGHIRQAGLTGMLLESSIAPEEGPRHGRGDHQGIEHGAAQHRGDHDEQRNQPPQHEGPGTLHLGNGASAAAIRDGQSVDTSMGLTPLEGLVMGTRCGDIDPALVLHLVRVTGKSNDEVESILNKQSGLKGICGDNDMRIVVERATSGDDLAKLAIDMFAYRIKKYIGAYAAVLGRVDAVVFTAGIGENSSFVREQCCRGLAGLGIIVDPEKNQRDLESAREIQADDSPVKVLVVPTNEELQIAVETVECIEGS